MKLINDMKYYKMSELVQISGLSNHTIQFYSKKELLPNTLSTSKNMKYYPEITLTVLNLIKYLKENFIFSIDYIKELFDYYKVDFSNRSELIIQSIEMISYEIKNPKTKKELSDLHLEDAINYEILEDKEIYFKTEIKILEIFDELIKYDISVELIIEYVQTSKRLAIMEKRLADRVLNGSGKLPEILILDILNRFKPFIFNHNTINIFKG